MNTKYDWMPGARWRLLKPEGPLSIRQTVVTKSQHDKQDRDALLQIYRLGGLCGQALVDARAKYGEFPKS